MTGHVVPVGEGVMIGNQPGGGFGVVLGEAGERVGTAVGPHFGG